MPLFTIFSVARINYVVAWGNFIQLGVKVLKIFRMTVIYLDEWNLILCLAFISLIDFLPE